MEPKLKKSALSLGGWVVAAGMSAAAHGQMPQPGTIPDLGASQPPRLPDLGGTAQGAPTPATQPVTTTRPRPLAPPGQILRPPPPIGSYVRSVADEPRPEWDPLGVPVGALLIYPSLGIEALGKTNVRATENGRRSDVAAVATAGLAAESNWGRHYVGTEGYYRRTEWATLEDESRSEFGALARLRYDITAISNLSAVAQFDRLTQPREDINAPDNARIPAQIDRMRGNISYQRDNGLTLVDADITVDRRTYRSTVSFNGNRIDQSARDFTRYQGSLRVGYAVSGSASLIVAGSLNKRVFDRLSDGINRSSSGGTLEAGLLFRPSDLLSAEVRAGYLMQNFRSPQLNDAKGLSLTANVVWNALPRTSFRLEATRRVSESSSSVVQSQILTRGTFGIDREILPNLIATVEANYEHINYIGIDRDASLYSAALKGRYLMSRLTSVTFSVEHVRRTATVSADRFSGQQARIGIRFTL